MNIDVDGLGELQAEFEELEQRGTSDAVYQVENTADYAPPIEFGRGPVEAQDAEALRFEVDGEILYRASVQGHPPYPFFRPAIRELENSDAERFVRDNLGVGFDDVQTTTDVLSRIASALEAQIKTNATAQTSGRSPGTHPDHPQVQTGTLRNATRSRRIR